MTDAAGDEGDDTARVEADHWRAMADERSAELQRLKRRPLVRAALALDRRLEPGRRAVSTRWQRWRSSGRKAAVTAAAAASMGDHGKRRAALVAEVAALPPAPQPSRTVATIEIGSAPRDSTADLLCFVPPAVTPLEEGWVRRLAAAVCGDVVAATPTLVHPARTGLAVTEHYLRVRAAGFEVEVDEKGTPVVSARNAGESVLLRGDPHEVVAASLRGLVVDRQAFVAAGGLEMVDDEDVTGIDVCARLRLHGGRVVHVPDAALFDDRPVLSRVALYRPVDDKSPSWRMLIDRRGPMIVERGAVTHAVGAAVGHHDGRAIGKGGGALGRLASCGRTDPGLATSRRGRRRPTARPRRFTRRSVG